MLGVTYIRPVYLHSALAQVSHAGLASFSFFIQIGNFSSSASTISSITFLSVARIRSNVSWNCTDKTEIKKSG